MVKQKIYIKYMLSLRCILMVKEELRKLDIPFINVTIGEIETPEYPGDEKIEALKTGLEKIGLELLDNKRSILIEKIKNEIHKMIHHSESLPKVNFSDFLNATLGYDYNYLSNIFTEVQGITIRQFIIFHKIEKVKELLLYNKLSLTEISFRLDYSSVSHLSNQFKKVTGLTPSFFKQMRELREKHLKK